MSKRIRRIIVLIISLALVAGAGFFAFHSLFPDFSVEKTTQQVSKVTQMNKADKANITTEEVHIQHDDINLFGRLYAPANYRSLQLPLIILSHGYGSNADVFDSFAQKAAEQGYLLYTFDFYGGGPETRSGDPDMLDMSIQTEKADLQSVLSYWKKQSFIDSSYIYLAGFSQGGLISTMVAGEHPADVKALILVAPAFNIPDIVRQGMSTFGYSDISQVPATVSYDNRTIGHRYIADALSYDVEKDQKAYNGPVLIIHGTADDVVPYSYSETASHVFSHAQLVTLDGIGHSADASSVMSALPQLIAFLVKN
ncbi:alpha/beta fold hydrolase [Alloscardovia theropitheci]|uniref:Alpha/beta fold hydrolase n=1 Tax=Alloscardovia theropitheci TaxID=2496842 RepID=A0A4R0QQK3_9BIFI|nr:alpha/beta fold hydrolase [Alloscardovia theropitheci]TCD53598.1 alpha/beta fold hydrolase [Alloscardovia theropitheci]